MPKSTVVLVLVAFLLTSLVLPTGASGSDQLWAEPAVVLEPHDGPNGQYATINGDGELEVDLSNPGVNADAVTVVEKVFYITNEDNESVAIWFSHEAEEDVVLSIDGQPAQDSDDPVVLAPDERANVSVTVDSADYSPGTILLEEFTIHAEEPSSGETSTSTSTSDDDGSGEGELTSTQEDSTAEESPENESPQEEPTAAEPTTEAPPSHGEDAVIFEDGTDPSVTIQSVPSDRLSDLPGESAPARPPDPAIDAAPVPRTLASDAGAFERTDRADVLVRAGESLLLTGERTVFGDADAVQPDGRVVRLVEIDVPADRRNDAAYVRLAVNRSALGGTNAMDARIGRHTDDGWQLLETSVVEADDQQVVFQARTTGFSAFAVFADPAVTYTWELPDGRTVQSLSVTESFEEPGVHDVSLTVTDARGRSATADYRVLANDVPEVTIEAPESIPVGEPVTLRANVTDEVGNVTVTWHFADGSKVVGSTVERTFEAGEHPVAVEVVDEYGASTRQSATLVVGSAAEDGQVSIDLFQLSLSIEKRLVYAAILLFLLIAAFRELAERRQRVRVR